MSVTLIFLIFSIIYCSFLNILYFKKKHVENYETKIFGIMIVSNLAGLFLEVASVICIKVLSAESMITIIVNKFFLMYLLTFLFLFVLYIFLISFKKTGIKSEQFEKNYIKIKKIVLVCYLIAVMLAFVLPIEIIYNGKIIYSQGLSTKVVFVASAVCVLICIWSMVKNYNNIKNKKYLPLFLFVVFGSIITIIQYINPGLTLASSMETFLMFVMYFTIENPDMKMIEQLNIAKGQAEQANHAKTDFLSSMSHEIRTPLNAIVGFSQSLSEEDIPASAKEEVNDILMASDVLLDIVNGILDISKIEANKLEIINTEYSFKKIFNDLVVLSKARLGDKPLEFRISYDESIPDTLYGDYSRIKQVILNLLTNSIKYTKEGYLEFKVVSVKKDNVCRLIISVEDSGIGIKKESIDKLFTRFERLDAEKNTTTEGTGLGLAITKKLVELMNGQIIVQSIYGKGSRFTVVLDQAIILNKKVEEVKEEVKIEDIDLSNKKVLVVDDNKVNLKVASRLLQKFNVNVIEALSGFECIDKINSGEKFDLILMDDMMPKMSGVETLAKLKEMEGFSIPTIALTANAISGMKEKYLGQGFNDYLSKPIDRNELNSIIIKFLGKNE